MYIKCHFTKLSSGEITEKARGLSEHPKGHKLREFRSALLFRAAQGSRRPSERLYFLWFVSLYE